MLAFPAISPTDLRRCDAPRAGDAPLAGLPEQGFVVDLDRLANLSAWCAPRDALDAIPCRQL
jgi:hypothetical protein